MAGRLIILLERGFEYGQLGARRSLPVFDFVWVEVSGRILLNRGDGQNSDCVRCECLSGKRRAWNMS